MFHIFYIVRCAWAKIFIGVSIVIAATVASGSGGQRVELGWDAPTDSEVVGYRLKYGTASGSYDQEVNVTGVTVGTAENLAAGTPYYFVVTSYNQDMAESLPSEELVVTTGANPLPVISLIIPGNSYGWTSPASITLKASASAGVGTIQRVEFYNGAEKLGEDSVAPYALAWGGVGEGAYQIVARAFDDQGGWSDSSGVRVVVGGGAVGSGSGVGSVGGPSVAVGQSVEVTGAGSSNAVAYQMSIEEAGMADFLVNDAEQQRVGMKLDAILSRVARQRATDMATRNYFGPVNLEGLGANALVRRSGYTLPEWWGVEPAANYVESIATGRSTAAGTWGDWMASSRDRSHLLGLEGFFQDQTAYGVGYAVSAGSPGESYWVVITAPPNMAVENAGLFVTESVPEKMDGGVEYSVSVQLINTGTKTWTDGEGYRLGMEASVWGVSEVRLPNDVAPGGEVNFRFTVKAPSGGGSVPFQAQMIRQGVGAFGELTPRLIVAVVPVVPVVPVVQPATVQPATVQPATVQPATVQPVAVSKSKAKAKAKSKAKAKAKAKKK